MYKGLLARQVAVHLGSFMNDATSALYVPAFHVGHLQVMSAANRAERLIMCLAPCPVHATVIAAAGLLARMDRRTAVRTCCLIAAVASLSALLALMGRKYEPEPVDSTLEVPRYRLPPLPVMKHMF